MNIQEQEAHTPYYIKLYPNQSMGALPLHDSHHHYYPLVKEETAARKQEVTKFLLLARFHMNC